MRISDWSSDVCSSDLVGHPGAAYLGPDHAGRREAVQGAHGRRQGILWLHPGCAQATDRTRLQGGPQSPDPDGALAGGHVHYPRSEEHTSELQSLMRTSYAAFCSKKKSTEHTKRITEHRPSREGIRS